MVMSQEVAGAIGVGQLSPVTAYAPEALSLIASAENVSFLVDVLVSTTVPVALVPTVTWPKSSDERTNGGFPETDTPVPRSVDWRETSEARVPATSIETVSVAASAPSRCGWNVATRLQLPPGRTGAGQVFAVITQSWSPSFDRWYPWTVSGTMEVFVIVADADPYPRTFTLPALPPERVNVGGVPCPWIRVAIVAALVT